MAAYPCITEMRIDSKGGGTSCLYETRTACQVYHEDRAVVAILFPLTRSYLTIKVTLCDSAKLGKWLNMS